MADGFQEKEKFNLGLYLKIAAVIIVLFVLYILFPKNYFNEVGSTYRPGVTIDTDSQPAPTSLQFRNPFKHYDGANTGSRGNNNSSNKRNEERVNPFFPGQ